MKRGLFFLMVFSSFIFPHFIFAQTWNQVNTSGFGDVNNGSSRSMAVYNNSLYVGTVNNATGTEIWRYDGTAWTQVNADSFGDINNKASLSMDVFNNNLYVGTQNAIAGTEVWRYDGTSWTQVNTDGFGDVMNRLSTSMAVYNNNLYVGTRNPSTGTEIWRYDGATWTQVNADGFGDRNNLRSFRMVVYNGYLYTGTENAVTGTEIWRYDGTNWTQVNTDGFEDANNTGSFSMAVGENYLYAGTENKASGTEIWRYDGTTWTQINPDGFGDLNNAIPFSMAAFGTLLFVGTDNATTGTEVWRYDGTTWNQVNIDGFGDASNASSVSMTIYNNSLYVGIDNPTTGAAVFFMSVASFVDAAGDDFDDNSKDSAKWGKDGVDGKGVLTENNQRLEYTTKGTGVASHDSVDRKWASTRFSYNADWTVQIDVTNTTSSSTFSGFGIDVRSLRLPDNEIEVELGQAGLFWSEFYGGKKISGQGWAASVGPNTHGAVRIAFSSATKVFTVYYDTDPSDGYQWTEFGSFGVGGTGGASGTRDWGLTNKDQFVVYVFGYSEKMSVTSGQLYGDNFLETGGGVLWTNHEELGGGESKATGVAALGSKSCVAVSGKGLDGNWYGQLRIYKPTGALLWAEPDPFDLLGGRTTQVAVSGSKVYVAGYYGTAGSGTEKIFVRAYDASTKSFKWEYTVDAPNAGLHPSGIAALGNYVVGFFNTDTGVLRGQLFGLNPLNGALKWSGEFGDDVNPSNKVNAIAMKGSKFMAVGYNQDGTGVKWFRIQAFSAVNGDSDWGYGFRPGGDGQENEALAVAWKGSIVGVAGYVSPDSFTRIGSVAAVIINPQGITQLLNTGYVGDFGNNSRCNGVAVSGTKIYAAGYGLDGFEQKAFVRAYDAQKEDPDPLLWSDKFDLTSLGGMVTTGMIMANNRIYLAGYGIDLSGTPDWFVKAYDLSGNAKWIDDFNLNGGQNSEAYGIAANSSAIVGISSAIFAVGQAKNGPDGPLEMAVRAYKP